MKEQRLQQELHEEAMKQANNRAKKEEMQARVYMKKAEQKNNTWRSAAQTKQEKQMNKQQFNM